MIYRSDIFQMVFVIKSDVFALEINFQLTTGSFQTQNHSTLKYKEVSIR